MAEGSFKCKQCGGPKHLYFVYGPARLTLTLLVLIGVFGYGFFVVTDVGLRLAVMVLGAFIAAVPLLTMLRLKCPICSSREEMKHMWGSL
jgi:hypothetical protein